MIEVLLSKSGERVVRRDGLLTASRVDPSREAREFLARHSAFLSRVKTVFVLGLGSGYHVKELQNLTSARLIVIEPDVELTETVTAWQSFAPDRVFLESAQSARELRSSARIREAIQDSFTILSHPPSESLRFEFFKDMGAQLLGRDWGSLNWQWNLKGLPSLEGTLRVEAAATPLTIYDLEQTELVQDSDERERLLIKALRELVK